MALASFRELQQRFWDPEVGLWQSSLWWQNANTLEALANLARRVPRVADDVVPLIATVFNATANETVGRCDQGVNLMFSGYFDDEDWSVRAVRRAPCPGLCHSVPCAARALARLA